MMSNLTPVMIWAATYFLHSSLLLGGVWCWFKWKEPSSHAFRETVWKLAAAGGFVTASLQLGLSIESPVNTALRMAWTTPPAAATAVVETSRKPARLLLSQPLQGPITVSQPEHLTIARAESDSDAMAPAQFLLYLPDEAGSVTLPAAEQSADYMAGGANITAVKASAVSNASQVESAISRVSSKFAASMTGVLAAIGGALVALSGWGLFRLFAEHTEFRQRLAGCRVVSTGLSRQILNDLLHQARVRRHVTLLVAGDDLEPGACGWRRWQIVLPARAVDDLSPQELRALLAHELAHLVRGDQWWLLLGRLLVVCFGWQPFNRVALREWQRASEYLCDAWAIQFDVERISLARCLTTVAEWRLVGMATIAGLGSGNPSNLTGRVERLIDDGSLTDPWQRYSRRHLLSAVGSFVAVGMVAYAPAATLSAPRSETAAKQVVQQVDPTVQRDETLLASGDVPGRAEVVSELVADSDPAEYMEILPAYNTDPSAPGGADLLVRIELMRAVQQKISVDMSRLTEELRDLDTAISQMPPTAQRPRWEVQLQQFRQRVGNMQRLRDAILQPM
ncbi:MAG: M56 family metallopeptidase [Planctomycetota bacterium]